jgi:hypothetical protein
MALNKYLQGVQRLLREQKQDMLMPEDLIEYVNEGRRETAQRTQCVRRLTPISGSVVSAIVTAQGHGYTAPIVTITAPDFPSGQAPTPLGQQATALAEVLGGQIVAVNIQNGGSGYFEPIATIADPTGTGATITLQISPINQLNPGQEVYNFSSIYLGAFPGVLSIHSIKSVSLIYSNYRYSLPSYSFSTYQAMIRQYPFQYQYVPAFFSQLGQGDQGSLYMYPLPSQIYQYEADCFCTPADLIDDLSVDVIPRPWDDVVKYFAASLAYGELQNWNAARYYLDLYDKMTLRKSQYARPGRATNPYGRW